MQTDGTIYYDTRIDPTNFDRDAKSLQKKLGSILKGIEKMSVGIENAAKATPAAIASARKQMVELQHNIDEFEDSLKQMENAGIVDKDFFKVEKQIKKTELALEQLVQKQLQMKEYAMQDKGWQIYKSMEASSGREARIEDYFADDKAWKKLTIKIGDTKATLNALNQEAKKFEWIKASDTERYSALSAGLEEARRKYAELNDQVDAFEHSSDGAFAGASKSVTKFGSMMKMTLARMMIREMINQMKEGFQNLAKYSSSFNKTMSDAKSSLSGFRNSLSTAFAPVVQTVIPYLVKLVDWLTIAMNAIGKFFAALSGKKTYVQATKAAENYAEAAGAAADAAERGARAFDELNEIDSSKASGGAGAGGANVNDMFEEVKIEGGFLDQLDNIKRIVEDIGILLLAWKLKDTFLGTLGKVASIGVAIRETISYVEAFMDAWKNGVDFGNLAQMITSLAVAVTALQIAFGPAVAGIGALIGACGLLLVALKDVLENGFNAENVAMAVAGMIAAFTGLSLFLGDFGFLLMGLGAGLVVAIVSGIKSNIEEIKTVWQPLVDAWTNFWDAKAFSKEWWEYGAAILDGLWQGLKDTGKILWDWFINDFWNPLVEDIKGFLGIHSPSTLFEDIGINILQGLFDGVYSMISPIWNVFSDIWEGIKAVFEPVTSWLGGTFADAWEAVKNVFSDDGNIFEGIKEGVENTFKTIVNKLIDGINTIIAKPFNKINSMLSTIRNAEILGLRPFRGIGSVSVPQIPKLATGAVIPANREFLAILGDQNKGTNIETPESLLRQIIREELDSEGNDGRPIYINVRFGNSTMKRVLIGTLKDIRKTSGVEVSLG